MADSRREIVMKAFKANLETITISNGYDFDIGKVLRIPTNADDLADYPSIILHEDFEDQDDESMGPDSTTKITEKLRVNIDAWDNNEDLEYSDLNLILANIQKAVMTDRTVGGEAMDTRLISNEMILNDQIRPYGGVSQTVEIRYRHFSADPFNC